MSAFTFAAAAAMAAEPLFPPTSASEQRHNSTFAAWVTDARGCSGVAVLLNEAMLLGYERDWCARQATCSTIKFLLGLLPKQWVLRVSDAELENVLLAD